MAYILYGLAELSLSYLLSVFFQTPKTCADVAVLLIVLGDFLSLMFSVSIFFSKN